MDKIVGVLFDWRESKTKPSPQYLRLIEAKNVSHLVPPRAISGHVEEAMLNYSIFILA